MILAEMLGGRHPFRHASIGGTLSAVLRDLPCWRTTRLAAEGILGRLLAKDPQDRSASAAEVRADLTRLASSSDTIAIAPVVRPASVVRKRCLGRVGNRSDLVGYLV